MKKYGKGDVVAKQAKREETRNFSRIPKISQGLRKFRNHSENFAILAKFSLCEIFANLAKTTVHSEIFRFPYLL